MIKNIKVSATDENTRIDRWLKRNINSLNQSFIEKNIRKGFIKVNNQKVKSNFKVFKNDVIKISNWSDNYCYKVKKKINKNISKEIIKKFYDSIIFQNNNFIIFNKWSNIATQGGNNINISVDDIIKKISKSYSLVHRLDKETSGLLIISKNLKTTRLFGDLFFNNKIEKIYLAICQGIPKKNKSIIKMKITDKSNKTKFHNSITKYEVIKNINDISVILFAPLTGKKHQLRIVSKNLGCPIIGDTKYNPYKEYFLEELKLNAHFLKFFLYDEEFIFFSIFPDHINSFIKSKLNKFKVKKNLFTN